LALDETNDIVEILSAPDSDPDWLVPNLWLQGAMICLAGEAAHGKSCLCYTIMLALAAGEPTLSGIIPAGEPKRVLYFDEENGKQDREKYIRRAYQGLIAQNKREPDLALLHQNFWAVGARLGQEGWEETVEEWVEYVRPHVMIFDTGSPCFNLDQENDNSEASKTVKKLRRLMLLTDPVATSIVLRHAKVRTMKGGRRQMRGASAWQGAVDGVMFQVRAPGRPRKGGLYLTRLEPDKTRAWGLNQTIYITPYYTDEEKSGLYLDGSYSPNKEHRQAVLEEEKMLEEDK
jgi:RecA-family ATPase